MTKQLGSLSALLVSAILSATATAQDPATAEWYGRGVHQYFSGNSQDAMNSLSRAIDNGSRDPRVYYYRALASSRMGWSGNAESDLRMGAMLEASGGDSYGVSKALERVQGSARRELERYRALARADAANRTREGNMVRYDELRGNNSQSRQGPVARPPVTMPAPMPSARPLTTAPPAPVTRMPPAAPPPPQATAPPAATIPQATVPQSTGPQATVPQATVPGTIRPQSGTSPVVLPPSTTMPPTPPAAATPSPLSPRLDVPSDEELPVQPRLATPPPARVDDDPFGEPPARSTTPAAPPSRPVDDPFSDD